jgi:Flp pilus assembly pilin Flp
MSIPCARSVMSLVVALVRDERGDDLIEYALLVTFIGLAGLLLFPLITAAMGVAYTNWNSNTQAVWIPCQPQPATCP